jgi:peptide/nickel transport system permease protein
MAIPIAIISATRQYSAFDYFFTFLGFIGLAMPTFLLALVVTWIVYSATGIMITGLFSQEFAQAPWSFAKFVNLLQNAWMPIIIVGISGTAGLIRVLRATLLDELRKQYVVTARAKGVAERRLLFKYPIRIAMNPIFSTIGWLLPSLVSGQVIVAIVLNLQTVGPVLLRATLAQDMYLAGSIVLILAFLTVIGTFLSDLLLAWVDPRIRYERKN